MFCHAFFYSAPILSVRSILSSKTEQPPTPQTHLFSKPGWPSKVQPNKTTPLSQIQKERTLQGINISHLGKRKLIFKMPFLGDMLVPWRVHQHLPCKLPLFIHKAFPNFHRTFFFSESDLVKLHLVFHQHG